MGVAMGVSDPAPTAGEEVETQLEAEVDTLKTQLHEFKERSLSAEASLLDSQQLFTANLQV